MRGSRIGALAVTAAIGLATSVVTTSAPAHATTAECDATGVVGRFRAVESGVSFDSEGRRVELQNESIFDTYSRAEIKSGYQSGDLVWIDRSINRMSSLSPKYFWGDDRVRNQGGGWRQCGPFNGFRTQSAYSWHRATRACFRPVGGSSQCGKWYIDQ